MKKCKVCGDKTEVVFNIEFKATPICEGCATAIFLQQAKWYAKQEVEKLNKPDVSGSVCDHKWKCRDQVASVCTECGISKIDG